MIYNKTIHMDSRYTDNMFLITPTLVTLDDRQEIKKS